MPSLTRALAALLFLAACEARPKAPPGPSAEEVAAHARTLYPRIRGLLQLPVEDRRRAMALGPLVSKLCLEAPARAEFLDGLRWSLRYAAGQGELGELAVGTMEHVATRCARLRPESAFELLDGAEAALPKEPRLMTLRARLLSALGDKDKAIEAAGRAVQAGSAHAQALKARLLADRARLQSGFGPASLQPAIDVLKPPAEAGLKLVDLTAILLTKARLLEEQALWQDDKEARAAGHEAAMALMARLSVAPFLAAHRRQALDLSCLDAALRGGSTEPCKGALAFGNLGAAAALGVPSSGSAFDRPRAEGLKALRAKLAALPKGARFLLLPRGDAGELLAWSRALGYLLQSVSARAPEIVVLNRSEDPAARPLIERVLARAGLRPAAWLQLGHEALAIPCAAALLSGEEAVPGCPLDKAGRRALRARPPALSILVGRGLRAEVEDFQEAKLPVALLSLRETKFRGAPPVWLKDVSDVLALSPPAVESK